MPSQSAPAQEPGTQPSPREAPAGGARPSLPWFAAVAALTLLVYLPTLRNGFLMTWEDGGFIVGNPLVQQLRASTIVEAFTSFQFHYWTPLAWLSLAVDRAVWGPEPLGFHLTNAILHSLNAGLVFLVALRLLETDAAGVPSRARRWAALLAALAWSLHPLRVEAVAWASERKSLLALFFGLLAVGAYLDHARDEVPWPRSRHYWRAFGWFCLSLLSKPALVTLPIVLALLDAWPLRRPGLGRSRDELAEKAPLLAAAALCTVVTMVGHSDVAMPLSESGALSRVLIALRAAWEYLSLSLWPAGLSPFYLHPGNVSLSDVEHLVPALLVIGLTGAALVKARRHPAITVAWLAWLLLLAPGLASTQVSLTSMADRFTYPAAIALSLLAAAGAAPAIAGLGRREALAAAAGIAGGVALLAALSVRQSAVWHDDVSLWTRPIELDPRRSGRVYTQRADARAMLGDLEGARADMDESIAIAASKGYGFMHNLYAKRAGLSAEAGDLTSAIADYGRALLTATGPERSHLLRQRAALHRAAGEPGPATEDDRLAAQAEP